MTQQFVTQDRVILYVQPDGAGTAMTPLSLDKHGMADKVHPGPGRTVIFGRDEFGRYVSKLTTLDPPGGLNTSTVEEDGTGTISFLSKMFDRIGCFPIQERYVKCGRLDGPTWNQLWHYGRVTITQKTHGAGPSREASGANIFDSFDVSWPYTVELLQHALTALTTGEDQNILDIAVLSDLVVGCNDCFPGYSPDEIIYLSPAANAGSPGDEGQIWYSTNGGGTFAVVSSIPFGAGEDVEEIEIGFISDTQFRVIVASGNSVKYSDFTLGAEGTSSWSAALTVGTDIEEMAWLFYTRLYIAADGDIYISDDQGVSVGAAIYTGTEAINDIQKSYDGEVWAVGDSNTILRERNQSGTFEAMTGPTGGGDFTAVAIANDGRIYAGNGTSIYVSTNGALNAGGWTELRDFGGTSTVVAINLAGGSKSQGGDSQLIRVVVDYANLAVVEGQVWESEDGGASWKQVTALTNSGYNCAAFSPIDDNLAFIGCDAGAVHKLSAKN